MWVLTSEKWHSSFDIRCKTTQAFRSEILIIFMRFLSPFQLTSGAENQDPRQLTEMSIATSKDIRTIMKYLCAYIYIFPI